jgi:hypothetical protein
MRTGIAAEAAAESALMKLAPQMKRMNCVLILGVDWPVLKETRNKILDELSIRDNEFPACGKFRASQGVANWVIPFPDEYWAKQLKMKVFARVQVSASCDPENMQVYFCR